MFLLKSMLYGRVSQTFSLWNLKFFAMDPPLVLTSLRFHYGRVSSDFLTVEPQVFCH